MRQGAGFAAHRRHPLRVPEQCRHLPHKSLCAQLALWNQQRGAGLREQFGIAQLMIVSRAGKRHEQSALARRRNFGNRGCAGAADDQIGIGKALRHVVDECARFHADFVFRVEAADRLRTRGCPSGARASDSECDASSSAAVSRTMRFNARAPWLPPKTSSVGCELRRARQDRKMRGAQELRSLQSCETSVRSARSEPRRLRRSGPRARLA